MAIFVAGYVTYVSLHVNDEKLFPLVTKCIPKQPNIYKQ